MIRKILFIIALISTYSIYGHTMYPHVSHEQTNCYQPIKKVSLKNENDQYYFCIDFIDKVNFIPRIHTLTNGIKIILSFNHDVYAPQTGRINHKIINGYFFEQVSNSSIIAILSLKGNIVFTEKKYTKNSIKIGFRVSEKRTIVIDAGHGGKDPGTLCLGDSEKNMTLVAALELRNMLLSSGKYDVILTRDRDKFVSIEKRRNHTNSIDADILISLHTDSNNDKNICGISVYTLPTLEYLKQGNDKTNFQINSDNYYKILALSREFSKILVSYIPNMCKIKNRPCRDVELKILKVKIPAVLIELGCVSNEKDNQLLHSKEFRAKTNRAILFALNDFFEKVY